MLEKVRDKTFGRLKSSLLVVSALAFTGVISTVNLYHSPHAYAASPVIYNEIYSSRNPLDTTNIYPGPTSGSTVVVLVHGGGWRSNASTFLPEEALSLQAAGFTVFDVNYSDVVSGLGAFPAEIDDVIAATGFAIHNALEYNGDPSHLVMIGGSAGGQLVGMASEEIDTLSPNTVKAVITLSGAFDFVKIVQDIQAGTLRGYMASVSQVALNCKVTKSNCTTGVESMWSPAENLATGNCPRSWLILNGSDELMPVDQPDSMTAALDAHGCKVTESIINTHGQHSFAYWGTVQDQVIGFIKSVTA